MNEERLRSRGVRIRRKFRGTLRGWKPVFNKVADAEGTGYANIVPQEGAEVEGIVYETDEASIRKLDGYEDYPTAYTRRALTVKDDSGRDVRCIAYIAERTGEGLRPTREYLHHLLKGSALLSEPYREFLIRVKTAE